MTKDTNNNNTDGDEEHARILQEQFREEVQRQASPQSWQQIEGAFSSSPPRNNDMSLEGAPVSNKNGRVSSRNGSAPSPSVPPRLSTPAKKKKKAKSSAATPETQASTPSPHRSAPFDSSYVDEKRGREDKRRPSSSGRSTPLSSPRGSPKKSPPASIDTCIDSFGEPVSVDTYYVDTSKDARVARRLDLELRDAELASRLANEESSAAFAVESTRAAPQDRDSFAESPPEKPETCRQKFTYYSLRIISAVLMTGIAFLVYITMFGGQTSDALDPETWLPGWPDEDPMLGSVNEHNVWKTKGQSGLRLQVLNNLESDSNWREIFQSSIEQWNEGSPKAVDMSVRQMSYDPDCRAVRRSMKVCNGNYGPTNWRGVNQILLQNEYIITSLAKMNDYYLEGTNRAQKMYTMCHELGHGLGLGHSDENFHNKDLVITFQLYPLRNWIAIIFSSTTSQLYFFAIELPGQLHGLHWTAREEHATWCYQLWIT